jgi:AcrR family transcriptional regulator
MVQEAPLSREKIKQAALELFRRYSYVKTSVSDIATASGIGKGTVYLSFKTKEEILFAILDDAILAKKDQVSPLLFDPAVGLDEKLSLFSQDILDLHFQIRDLMFGSFENVEGRELQDVYLKFANYIERSAEFLGEVIALHGYEPTPARVAAIREYFLFLSGRFIIYILSHDWQSREGIHQLMPGWSRSLFHALVPKE